MVEHRAGWTAGRWRCCIKARLNSDSDYVQITVEIPKALLHEADAAELVLYQMGKEAAITSLSAQLAHLIEPIKNPETT